ncbi:hypothetical protein ABIA22_000384 [Sinorhizobium fredii]|uniref:hypothetical protein n=1 Tax=Rhizobium fredii TaxID=380 RepID=UPI00351889FB
MTPFRFDARARDFDRAVTRQVQAEFKKIGSRMMPDRNTQRFSHGRSWLTKPNNGGDEAGEMQMHSFEFSTRFEDIVSHNLEILPDFRRRVAESMHRQLMESLYETIERSTSKSGNVVDAKEHESMAQAFLAALRQIEFGVDEDGNVSMPEFHLGAEAHKKMMASLEVQSQEFEAEVEQVKAEKIAKALERERERLSKFPHDEEE